MDRDGYLFQFQLALKRTIDLVITLSGLVVCLPFMAIIALAIKLDSPGPIFFRHKRIGKDGRPFDLYKFRTMVCGGDDSSYMHYLKELIESEKDGDCRGMPYRKMKDDCRVTRVGRFLRCYYLDELPQLLNIVKGEMSLVGPRPHVQFEVDNYTFEQRRRLTVKPGATGLWQVAGKADCTFSELIDLDLNYIDHWNLSKDIKIVFRTVTIVLNGGERFWSRTDKKIPRSHPPAPPAVSGATASPAGSPASADQQPARHFRLPSPMRWIASWREDTYANQTPTLKK